MIFRLDKQGVPIRSSTFSVWRHWKFSAQLKRLILPEIKQFSTGNESIEFSTGNESIEMSENEFERFPKI